MELSALDDTRNNVLKHWLLFSVWIMVSSVLFVKPLIALVRLSLTNDNASHLILIPFLTAGLLFIERRTIFNNLSFDPGGGIFLFLSVIIAISVRWAGDKLIPDLRLTSNLVCRLLLEKKKKILNNSAIMKFLR